MMGIKAIVLDPIAAFWQMGVAKTLDSFLAVVKQREL